MKTKLEELGWDLVEGEQGAHGEREPTYYVPRDRQKPISEYDGL